MTWQEAETAIAELASKIDFKPDVIVAIVRGGIVPARLLATRLVINDMYCLTVRKQATDRKVVTTITDNIQGKSVLLVEDVLESGKSLITAKDYLESLGAEVKTTSLYLNPNSGAIPDYYLKIQEQIPEFPWERLTNN